jgi:hypothetical protein
MDLLFFFSQKYRRNTFYYIKKKIMTRNPLQHYTNRHRFIIPIPATDAKTIVPLDRSYLAKYLPQSCATRLLGLSHVVGNLLRLLGKTKCGLASVSVKKKLSGQIKRTACLVVRIAKIDLTGTTHTGTQIVFSLNRNKDVHLNFSSPDSMVKMSQGQPRQAAHREEKGTR